MPDILRDLLANGADAAPAISAPARPSLSFGALRALIGGTISQLNAFGIGRNDRVAIVLTNGPEMATCFMACASGVTSAPLNPAYRAAEFEFYLSDLNARALIVEQDSTSAAIEVAIKLGVRLLDLIADRVATGLGETSPPRKLLAVAGSYAQLGHAHPVLAHAIAAKMLEVWQGLTLTPIPTAPP